MLVRIIATGVEMHVPVGQMTDALIASKIWERVVEPPKPVEVRWFLFKEEAGQNFAGSHMLGFACGHCKSKTYFAPDINLGAKKVQELARPHCTHRTTCPIEIAEQYIMAGGGQPIPKWELDGAQVNKEQAASLSSPPAWAQARG